MTNIALAVPLLIATESARQTSQSIHGLLFMTGTTMWLEVSIVVGFWLYKLRPWLKQIHQVHPKWVNTIHGDIDVGNAAVLRIFVQLCVIFMVNGLVGLDYRPIWLQPYRSIVLRVLAGTSLFCGLWCQVMPEVPPLLRTTSLSLACACIYLLLCNSWEGLIVVILPLGVLSETLPVQLQQLVEMLQTLPIHQTAVSSTGLKQQQTLQSNSVSTTTRSPDTINGSGLLPLMQRSISAAAEDYVDFQWFGLISFRKLESVIRYITLAHLALFLPRTQPLTINAFNHQNLLPPNSPAALQYVGLTLYVCLPILQLLDFRWQLRQWYHKMRDYQSN